MFDVYCARPRVGNQKPPFSAIILDVEGTRARRPAFFLSLSPRRLKINAIENAHLLLANYLEFYCLLKASQTVFDVILTGFGALKTELPSVLEFFLLSRFYLFPLMSLACRAGVRAVTRRHVCV